MKPNKVHVMFETGISVPYPWHTMFPIMPDEHIHDSTCCMWRLREKLAMKNRRFNRMLKWILLPLAFIFSMGLLVPLSLLVILYVPAFASIIGIMYGISVFIVLNLLNYYLDDRRIVINYYYKHRKFQ